MKSGESLFLSIKKATTKTFTIDGNAFTLEYKGEEITPDEDGTIRLCFDDVVYGEDAVVKITAKEDATENIEIID